MHHQSSARASARPLSALATGVVLAGLLGGLGGGCASKLPPEIAEARRLLSAGSYDEAERAAKEAEAQHPAHPARWRILIEAVHRQGDARRATELYAQWRGQSGEHDGKVLARLALTTLWQGLRVPSAKVRVDTILAIERQEVETLADEVDALMTNDSDIVAAAASTALLRGRPGAPQIATQLLVSEDPGARAIAVAGIGRKIGKRARVDLKFSLRDGDPRVRIAGIGALAPIGHPDDTGKLFALATDDPVSEVRVKALEGLGKKARKGAVDVAVRALDDPELAVRMAALSLLKALDQRIFIERIARNRGDVAAVHAWAMLGGPPSEESAQAVARVLANPGLAERWPERVALAGSVGQVLPRAEALARLKALAGDSDGRVRVAAAFALLELGAPEGTAVLSDACRAEDTETRAAAVVAHNERKLLSPGLIDALADDSALIRVQAAEAVWRATRR